MLSIATSTSSAISRPEARAASIATRKSVGSVASGATGGHSAITVGLM